MLIKKIKEYGIVNVFKYILEMLNCKKKNWQIKNNKIKIIPIINFKTNSKFIFDDSLDNILDKLEKKEIIESANKILNHNFDLLGSGMINLGKDIKWNEDFKTSFIWENKFYKDIKIINLENNSDVKVPWELSRFQHVINLGLAYKLTNNNIYYKEFKEEVLDWIKKNPRYYSVNWTCNMDVSIRAINWLAGYYLFQKKIEGDIEFKNILDTSLYGHGEYIYNNLEKSCVSLGNNHYLSNLNGLIFLGVYFKNYKNKITKKWLNKGKKELEKEMKLQNNEDGTNYETSTSYHRLVTELMFFPIILLNNNNINMSIVYKDRLKKMFEFMALITKPNGKVPLIGDVDNGRLFILSNYSNWKINDFRSLISLGGEYFNDEYLKSIGENEVQDKLLIFGKNEIYSDKKQYKNIKFEKGGYYLLQNENIYCLIRCGELSMKGQGGHSHNDQLAFELNIKGEDIFIDSGMYTYTSNKDMRNLFRSTKTHNTVSIKGIEQNYFNENNLFEMREETFSKCLKFSSNEFEGEHYGYKIKNGIIHNRVIKINKENIYLFDKLFGGENKGEINLILSPRLKVKKNKNIIYLENSKIKLEIKGLKKIRLEDTLIALKYGIIIGSKKIVSEFHMDSCIEIKIISKEEV